MVDFYFILIAFIILAGGIFFIIWLAMKGSENLPKNKKKRWEPK